MKWPKACLGELATLERRSLLPEEIASGTSYLGLEHIESGGRILGYQRVAAGELKSNKFVFSPSTLLYGKLRPYLAKICIPDREGCCSTDILPIRPGKDLDINYLRHLLLSRPYVDKASSLCAGANLPRISPSSLLGIEIPLPPLEDQRRIAAILDKASQILTSSRKADELRQHLLERVFTSMFGDPRENPIGWPKLAIEEFTSDYVGGAALVPEDFEDEGVHVLHKGAIKPGGKIEADSRKKGFVSHQTAQNYKRCLAGPGRIAVTLRDLVPSGPFIGLMAELSTTGAPEYLLAQGAYAFRVDARRVLPDYLIALVNMPTFRLILRQNAVGSTQIHIRLPIFKSIEIPVPPIENQLEFAQVVGHICSIDTLSRCRVRHVDELTRSLQISSF